MLTCAIINGNNDSRGLAGNVFAPSGHVRSQTWRPAGRKGSVRPETRAELPWHAAPLAGLLCPAAIAPLKQTFLDPPTPSRTDTPQVILTANTCPLLFCAPRGARWTVGWGSVMSWRGQTVWDFEDRRARCYRQVGPWAGKQVACIAASFTHACWHSIFHCLSFCCKWTDEVHLTRTTTLNSKKEREHVWVHC